MMHFYSLQGLLWVGGMGELEGYRQNYFIYQSLKLCWVLILSPPSYGKCYISANVPHTKL